MKLQKTYKYSDLPLEAQAEVLKDNRLINVEEDVYEGEWFDSIFNELKKDCQIFGIEFSIDSIFFKLFGRGRGLWVFSKDIKHKYKKIEGIVIREKFGAFRDDTTNEIITSQVLIEHIIMKKGNPLGYGKMRKAICRKINRAYEAFEKALVDLENEYKYQTSDKAVIERLELMEYEFYQNSIGVWERE